jgi:pentatricopeptide repeat protein
MREDGVDPDQRAFLFTFQAIALLAEKEEGTAMQGQVSKARSFEIGRALHADARAKGLSIDSYVSSALVCMYGKCEALVEAEDAIASLPKRNLIAWNAMLSAYIKHGMAEKALGSYRQMLEECAAVDDVTLLSLLQACGEIGCPEICECIHFDAVSAGFEGILPVAATLIHAYGSGASMEDAESIFDGISEPHIPAWNACIAGHAGKGSCRSSLEMFERLRMSGSEPDEVTFILKLSACSHCGLISEGIRYFLSMHRDYGLIPDLRHYGIMANLLGRVGSFRNLESMLGKMRMQANSSIYLCLLGACRTHGNIELAKQAFEEAVKHRPKHAIPYVLMSNVIANAEMEGNAHLEALRCRE